MAIMKNGWVSPIVIELHREGSAPAAYAADLSPKDEAILCIFAVHIHPCMFLGICLLPPPLSSPAAAVSGSVRPAPPGGGYRAAVVTLRSPAPL